MIAFIHFLNELYTLQNLTSLVSKIVFVTLNTHLNKLNNTYILDVNKLYKQCYLVTTTPSSSFLIKYLTYNNVSQEFVVSQ